MSEAAKQALINARSSKIGALAGGDGATEKELRKQGLVGSGGGLTGKGSIEREKLVRAAEDAVFG